MERHFRLLGYLFIVWAAVEVVAITILWFAPTGMRPAWMTPGPVPPAVVVIILITAAFYVLVGWSLLTRQSWGRTVAIVGSIIALFNFPLGTALGIYGLWTTLSGKGREAWVGYYRRNTGPATTGLG